MKRPATNLGEVHVGVVVFLYEAQQVGLEGFRRREKSETDGQQLPASPETLSAWVVTDLHRRLRLSKTLHLSGLNTNLLAQLNVDLISKTDISISSLYDLLGHTVDRHPHLGLPVGHVDLDQFEDGHGLFLLLFLIDKSERFAGNKKIRTDDRIFKKMKRK